MRAANLGTIQKEKKLVRVTLLFRHSISNFYALSLENCCYGGAGGLLLAE
jgi:hypothetical protein